MKKTDKFMTALNCVIILAIFVLNFFYQSNGFDFTLKCVCSCSFALLGIINFVYALETVKSDKKFWFGMVLGLILAAAGDITIGYSFILGAAVFALGHVCFVVAYCFIRKMKKLDLALSAVIFLCALMFLLFCPLLNFDVPVFKVVCIVYALIISTMLGKAIGNFIHDRNAVTSIIAVASSLFFFSDLMLVFDWFIGLWDWTSEACMGTYYPALCLLGFSMMIKILKDKKEICK